MKKLILTVGLPRSGKSTWALEQGFPIVCPDSIRLALLGQKFYSDAEPMVWAIARIMTKALFLSGHNIVIIDATNVTQKRRDFWKGDDLWVIAYKEFFTTKEECIMRAEITREAELIPVIERMFLEREPIIGEQNGT